MHLLSDNVVLQVFHFFYKNEILSNNFYNIVKSMYTRFFISKTFISNARLKLAKNQANAKKHPEVLPFEVLNFCHLKIMHLLQPHYYPKIIGYIPVKNKQKNKCVCFHEIIRLIIMKIEMKMKNTSHRYDINRTRSSHEHKYSKYKKHLSMMILTCITQHLSNI